MTGKRNNRHTANFYIFILIFFLFSAETFSQMFDKEQLEILEIQDTRNKSGITRLGEIALASDSKNAVYAIKALANIADTNSVLLLNKILENSNNPKINEAVYFALGQINCSISREILLGSLKSEKNSDALIQVFNALGKTGDEYDLNSLLNTEPVTDELKSAMAMAIARFGMRKIKNDASFNKLAELLELSNDSSVRKNIAFAFNRIGDKQVFLDFNTELMTLSHSPEPFTRMWALSGIGKQLDTAKIHYLAEMLEKDPDWRVRVNILSSLGNQLIDLNSPLLDEVTSVLLRFAVDGGSVHESIAAWQSLGKIFAGADTRNPQTRKIQQDVQFVLTPNKAIDWQVKAEAIRTYTRIFKDEIKDELLGLFSRTDNYDLKAAAVESFGYMDNAMLYKELRDSISADVQRYNLLNPNKDGSMIGSDDLAKIYLAFVNTLSSLDDKLDDENRNITRLIFSEFSASKNPVITDACLSSLQDSMYMKYRDETGQVMMFDYDGFIFPKDKDVMLMFIETWGNLKYEGAVEILKKNLAHTDYDIAYNSNTALKKITGSDFEKEITSQKFKTDLDFTYLNTLTGKKTATIKTGEGNIVLELFPETAPFTVMNFVKLGEKGYYNNTVFHRVLPNFVIQGGDPTSTGYGGPGYSIRSEFSMLTYGEYTLGMASSGKDTEGSQFFITHSPQPHLDGKYTLFGKVIEGFDVVDRIQIGDKIETITFSR